MVRKVVVFFWSLAVHMREDEENLCALSPYLYEGRLMLRWPCAHVIRFLNQIKTVFAGAFFQRPEISLGTRSKPRSM